MGLILIVVLPLNLGISFWNARSAGKIWVESRYAGGYQRFMVRMTAIMSATGFSWCYLLLVGFGLRQTNYVTQSQLESFFSLGYVVLVPGVLLSGYALTFDSWREAFHERSFASMGVAGWNSFASAYNTYNAVRGFGPSLRSAANLFKPRSGRNSGVGLIVIALAVVVVLAGTLTTSAIIKHYAASGQPLSTQGGSGATPFSSEFERL